MNRQDIEISDLRRITELVKDQYRYDFTNYAMSSFRRRILRIMELYKFGSADLLIKRLKDDKSFLMNL